MRRITLRNQKLRNQKIGNSKEAVYDGADSSGNLCLKTRQREYIFRRNNNGERGLG